MTGRGIDGKPFAGDVPNVNLSRTRPDLELGIPGHEEYELSAVRAIEQRELSFYPDFESISRSDMENLKVVRLVSHLERSGSAPSSLDIHGERISDNLNLSNPVVFKIAGLSGAKSEAQRGGEDQRHHYCYPFHVHSSCSVYVPRFQILSLSRSAALCAAKHVNVFPAWPVKHPGDDVTVVRHYFSADRALPRVLGVRRMAVRTAENVSEIVDRPGGLSFRTGGISFRTGHYVGQLRTTGEHDAVHSLTAPKQCPAERTGLQDLKVVPCLLRTAVGQEGKVRLAQLHQSINERRDDSHHEDHDRELHTVHSTEVAGGPQRALRGVAASEQHVVESLHMATFYVVATPIGNLSDITIRALDTLKSVDLIVCEDTRHSRRLLNHYGISKPLLSGHSHNERRSATAVVARLENGEDIAYITDAGTPGISDPGRTLVRRVRDAGFGVVPIPGPSALATILSVGGLPGKAVVFEGFLSPKAGRRRNRLSELLGRQEMFILYESPHRLLKLLSALADLDAERPILLGREITKMHEEFLEGSAKEVLNTMEKRTTVKGECVLLVGSSKKG